jgi:hypothetical protein
MDSAKLNDWMQVFGIFALVASLVFVGLQMKQSQEIAIAAQYQERYSTAVEYWIGRGSHPSEMRSVAEGQYKSHGPPSGELGELSAVEFGIKYSSTRQALVMYDNYHFQYAAGFLTNEAWETYKRQMRGFIHAPMIQWILTNSESSFRPSFITLINQEIIGVEQPRE